MRSVVFLAPPEARYEVRARGASVGVFRSNVERGLHEHWVQQSNRKNPGGVGALAGLGGPLLPDCLYERMLQNLTVPRDDEIPSSLRPPDEGGVARASVCPPELERGGGVRGPFTPACLPISVQGWLRLA